MFVSLNVLTPSLILFVKKILKELLSYPMILFLEKRIDYILGGNKGVATIVGLSTEGYGMSSILVANGFETTIVDETLQIGMKLTPEIVSSCRTVNELIDEEPLIILEKMDDAINKAKYVFFTPKMRRADKDAKTEINIRLKEATKNFSKNSTLINCVPMGFNENKGNVSMIERICGFRYGEDFEYVYVPLQPRTSFSPIIGIENNPSKSLIEVLKQAGFKSFQTTTLDVAELLYYKYLLDNHFSLASDFEICKKFISRDERKKNRKLSKNNEVYIDTVTEFLFDFKFILGTLDTGDPSLYISSGILKSFDSYVKYLVDEIRQVMRDLDLKASKTKVTLAWSVDKYEMRGGRLSSLDLVVKNLHDYIGDISVLSGPDNRKTSKGFGGGISDMSKVDIIVICSEKDYNYASKLFKLDDKRSDMVVLKANLLVDHLV